MSFLTLGWKVNKKEEPEYWLKKHVVGSLPNSELIRIESKLIGTHTAILAQSGSGKSFFLGRLIEEILINTKANCFIFDPNADFCRVFEIVNEDLWKNATYNKISKKGQLPHESSQKDFLKEWKKISIRIQTRNPNLRTKIKDLGKKDNPISDLKIFWTALDVDLFSEDVNAQFRSDLFHCHNFVQNLEKLLNNKEFKSPNKIDLLELAENLLTDTFKNADFKLEEVLNKKFVLKESDKEIKSLKESSIKISPKSSQTYLKF